MRSCAAGWAASEPRADRRGRPPGAAGFRGPLAKTPQLSPQNRPFSPQNRQLVRRTPAPQASRTRGRRVGSSELGRRAKLCRLTPAGRQELAAETETGKRFSAGVSRIRFARLSARASRCCGRSPRAGGRRGARPARRATEPRVDARSQVIQSVPAKLTRGRISTYPPRPSVPRLRETVISPPR